MSVRARPPGTRHRVAPTWSRAALGTAILLALLLAASAAAQDEASPPPPWSVEMGFSFLDTGGNSRTSSAGLDLAVRRNWRVWSVAIGAQGLRATEEENTTAERYVLFTSLRRRLNASLQAVGDLGAERDRLAGVDLRTIAGLGVAWTGTTAGQDPRLELTTEGTLTLTREELLATRKTSLGGHIGVASRVRLSPGAHTRQSLNLYPNFRDTSDFRFEAELSLHATLTRKLAVKLAHTHRRDNRPPPGFRQQDTSTRVSLVLHLEPAGEADAQP